MNRLKIFLLSAALLFASSICSANVDNPHGAGMKLDCQQCHVTEGWGKLRPDLAFDHNTTSFQLSGRHNTVSCRECHTSLVFNQAGSECISCHLDIHQGQFAFECSKCHTTKGWANQAEMYTAHAQTRFPLTGVHASLDCQACHAKGQYAVMPLDCQGCHLSTYNTTTNPNHQAAGFSISCSECHTARTPGWKVSSFDHTPAFPLTGGHNVTDCARCHISGSYNQTSAECYSCHRADYENSRNPNHAATQFPQACAQCHTTNGWAPAQFDHRLARFQLTGAHVQVNCADCHVGGQYTGTSSACYDCHRADFEGVTDPNHVSGQFAQTCGDCHTTAAWQPATFDHAPTQFPLTGAHIQVSCTDCHVNGQFDNTSILCWDCHRDDFEGVLDPNHVQNQFPQNCAECHTTEAWQPASFDHNGTAFPLTGAHAAASCTDCHIDGQYDGTSALCYDCHRANYEGVADPNHVAGNYPHNCEVCHSTTAWSPATIDHNATDFPLTGRHVEVDCAQCHVSGQFTGTPTDCWSCHQNDYNNADDPNHVQNQFPHDCAVCHTTNGWEPSSFDHSQSQFPLTGAHVSVTCVECHANGQYAGTPTDCWSCHQNDYNDADDPNHVQNQFPHDCAVCHTTSGWEPSSFDHAQTQFPLTGAHVSVNCAECHANGQYAGTPTDCWSCHEDDYNGVDDPNHVTNQFSHVCTECHTTNDWEEVTFNHNQTQFPLTGAHVSVNCIECHINGQYAGTPTDCYFCHQTDYDGTNDPNHAAAGFPHECAQCHTTNNWDAEFDHDGLYFPIYSGSHRNEWDQCSDCHTNPNNYSIFSCIICHEHNCNDMADEHDEVPDFVCESNACYECHPDGRSGDLRHRRPENKPRMK